MSLFLQLSVVVLNFCLLQLVCCEEKEVIQLYYGLDESERGVPLCSSSAQACGVLLHRFWRPLAHVRLCRCLRRRPCSTTQRDNIDLNKRANFLFCNTIDHLPACQESYVSLSIEMRQKDYSPEEFDDIHHQGKIVYPPNVTAYCKCQQPYYWQIYSRNTSAGVYPAMLLYKCMQFKYCKSQEFCGNVRTDVESLYQNCYCPRGETCAHDGGLDMVNAEELMYNGTVRMAHCQQVGLKAEESHDYSDYDAI